MYLLGGIGLLGNLLSAIVWLQPHVLGNNSSAVFLAALAISGIVFLVTNTVPFVFFTCDTVVDDWSCVAAFFPGYSAVGLGGLLVVAFSAERLYFICRPLKVRFSPRNSPYGSYGMLISHFAVHFDRRACTLIKSLLLLTELVYRVIK